MQDLYFEEIQRVHWVWMIAILGSVFMTWGCITSPPADWAETLGIALFWLGLLYSAWGFSVMTTRVTMESVSFGFRAWTSELALSDLRVGRIVPIRFWQGLGVHYIRGGFIANIHFGRGVEVWSGKTRFVIGSRDPERLHSVLKLYARESVPA